MSRASGWEPSVRALWLFGGLALVVGGVARTIGGFSEFWLDEVWTWSTVQRLESASEVFTRIHHSNNNHLVSLIIYALGDPGHWIVYRIPSLLAGTASIGLAAWLASARGRLEALLAAVLTASCFALLHFSSEARGYAIAVAAALAATGLLERQLATPRPALALGFGACLSLGLLAHLVTVFFWAATIAQSAWRLARRDAPARAAAGFVWLHIVPAATLALLYAVDLRFLAVGGGNPTDYAQLIARTVGFAWGLPVVAGLAIPYAAAALALIGWGVLRQARRGDDAAILYATAIVVAPVAGFAITQPEVVAVRYFLIGIALSLVLGAELLAAALRAGGARRALGLVVLAVFLIGNGAHTAAFLEHGRGGYREAVLAMASHSQAPILRVGSDHDFRNRVMLAFYARELPEGRKLSYVPRARWPAEGTEWFLIHRAAVPEAPIPRWVDARGNVYSLFAEYDHAAISGFYIALYRRSDAD